MWWHFLLENAHFAVNLLASLVLFAIFWLYFDAWLNNKHLREVPKLLGLFLLSLSFLVHAVFVETSILPISVLGRNVNQILFTGLVITGYSLLMIGVFKDPLQLHPQAPKKRRARPLLALALPLFGLPLIESITAIYPMLASLTGFLYLRRSTIGYEYHLRKAAIGFFTLSLFGLLSLGTLFRETTSVSLYRTVGPFGGLWLLEHLVLLVGILILGGWIWYYLFLRIQTQLFMIFTTAVAAIFLITTISFTALLVRNIATETLRRLETDAKVLELAVDSRKAELLADAEVVAQNPQVEAAVSQGELGGLRELVKSFFDVERQSFLAVVSRDGEILARGEDREQAGGSLSDDPLIKKALAGEAVAAVVSRAGALAPEMAVRSASPIRRGETVIGAVTVGTAIDHAFVDGLKQTTGFEASVYADDVLSATTLALGADQARPVGIRLENAAIRQTVLEAGRAFIGRQELLNTPYFAAYLPLRDLEARPIGMLFVGQPQLGVLQTAGRSIEQTYLVAVALLMVAVFPSYFISRYIAEQTSV